MLPRMENNFRTFLFVSRDRGRKKQTSKIFDDELDHVHLGILWRTCTTDDGFSPRPGREASVFFFFLDCFYERIRFGTRSFFFFRHCDRPLAF